LNYAYKLLDSVNSGKAFFIITANVHIECLLPVKSIRIDELITDLPVLSEIYSRLAENILGRKNEGYSNKFLFWSK
jgi:hypothetical protein